MPVVFQKILQILKLSELRNKILFVLGVFAIFRLMANVPIPGIDASRLQAFFEGNQLFGLHNLFTGGALDNLSIVMLGVGPYITSVIVMQLLTMIFPPLERLYKEEGETGKRKFNQYGRVLTIPFALVQGYAFLTLLSRQGIISNLSALDYLVALATVMAGTILLMWFGELITEKGIGNGVSLLIFAGIVAEFPLSLRQLFVDWDSYRVLSLAAVVLVSEARRNIPVSYAKRVRGMRMYGGTSTYLPLSVNPAGVIPIIFALSILLLPGMIAGFLGGVPGFVGTAATAAAAFFNDPWVNGVLYFFMVVLFTYFYTAVTFDPKTISENLQKMGGFVPGVRPGESTSKFIKHVLNRVLFTGAMFLGLIAVLPNIVAGATGGTGVTFLIGGTSLLIIVSVVLDTMRQINAQLQMREYDSF